MVMVGSEVGHFCVRHVSLRSLKVTWVGDKLAAGFGRLKFWGEPVVANLKSIDLRMVGK